MDIVFENVTKKIGRNIVVDNASFTIKSNSITFFNMYDDNLFRINIVNVISETILLHMFKGLTSR